MAKRPARGAGAAARAPKRRGAKRAPGRQSRKIDFTPRMMESIRQRYEHSADGAEVIGHDCGVSKSVIQRLAREQNWVVYKAPPRDLSAAERLALEAEALEASQAAAPPPASNAAALPASTDGAAPPVVGEATLPDELTRKIERLMRAVDTEIDVYEGLRARLKHLPEAAIEAERTARTLSSLTTTLHRLQRLRAGHIESTPHADYDDVPTDLDAFRDELARRIEAFMESHTDEELAEDLERARAHSVQP